MKAVILISSIFYLLGFKISNQIELFKKSSPAEKVITNPVTSVQKESSTHFKDEFQTKTESDSTKTGGVSDENILESK